MTPLSARRRSELRGEAHKLDPTVIIGDKGLTDEVIAEIDRSLRAHELVKVRAAGADRDVRAAWLDTICTRLEAHAVQQIGKVFVIYRENPPDEKSGPGPSPQRSGARGDDGKPGVRDDERLRRGREKQRAKDQRKRRERDIEDMRRKGKIPANVKLGPGPLPAAAGGRGDERKRSGDVKRTARPRSRTPSPLPASGPRRRRPRTSR